MHVAQFYEMQERFQAVSVARQVVVARAAAVAGVARAVLPELLEELAPSVPVASVAWEAAAAPVASLAQVDSPAAVAWVVLVAQAASVVQVVSVVARAAVVPAVAVVPEAAEDPEAPEAAADPEVWLAQLPAAAADAADRARQEAPAAQAMVQVSMGNPAPMGRWETMDLTASPAHLEFPGSTARTVWTVPRDRTVPPARSVPMELMVSLARME